MALLESHCAHYHFKYVPQKRKFTLVFISQVNLTTQYSSYSPVPNAVCWFQLGSDVFRCLEACFIFSKNSQKAI